MRRKRGTPPPAITVPTDFRLVVPILSVRGGAGRSVVAGLLAHAFASAAATVVVDPQPRVCSPWPDWVDANEGGGLPGLFALGRNPESYEIAHAALLRQLPLDPVAQTVDDVSTYSILTDQRAWDARPLPIPSDPAWYAALIERGGWSIGIVDTDFPAIADHIRDRHKARVSQLAGWCRGADLAPVVVAPATGAGISGLMQLLTVLETDDLPTTRLVVAITGLADTELPKRLQSRLGLVEGRVAALVRVPYDPVARLDGFAAPDKLDDTTLDAGRELARALIVGRSAPEPVESPPDGATTPGLTEESPAPNPASAPASPPFPTAAALAAMSANTGWVPVRPEPSDEPGEEDADF